MATLTPNKIIRQQNILGVTDDEFLDFGQSPQSQQRRV
jgi:hypothetical protein